MTTLTVTARGQVTFRKDVLQHLGIKPGDKLFVVNLMAHDDGKGPKEVIPLADVLSLVMRPDVCEGRSIAALFLAREWLAGRLPLTSPVVTPEAPVDEQ